MDVAYLGSAILERDRARRGNGYLYIGADNGLVRIAEKELAGQ